MDLQDDRRSDYPFREITEKIIGGAFEVILAIAPEHQAQIIYTRKATGIEVGLLIHFGNPKLETKRFNDTSESVSELKSSCKSCPSMFIHFVRKLMHTCLECSYRGSRVACDRRSLLARTIRCAGLLGRTT